MIALAFLVLAGQLWRIQIAAGEQYRQRADVNRIRVVTVKPPRGVIYDRAGRQVVRNVSSFTASVLPGDLPKEKVEQGAVIDRLAALPFDAQPGEKFVYGYNSDILGVVIEKISGMSLDEFFRTRIFQPLKMVDSSFFLPLDKRDRLAAVYSLVDGKLQRAPNPGLGQGDYVDGPRMCYSGGAGVLSTASDYARFLQMLLNGGELDGVRLLSPKTVELMTENHVGDLFNEGKTGFGLGFEILENPGKGGVIGSPGVFSWGGAYHTVYWADPKEKLAAVLMTQLLPSGGSDLNDKFRVLVYQSIVGPPVTAPAHR
jgi:CubicO group peptidase (beta-lactamase class C family)